MVNFQLISLFEVEVTPITSPALLLEQVRHFWRRLGMGTLSLCPVDPVSIKWAFPALYLHMPLDGRHAVEVQRLLFCRKAPPSLFRSQYVLALHVPDLFGCRRLLQCQSRSNR